MAPNIKERAAVNDSLAILNVNDLIKFAPLTSSNYEIPTETEHREALSHAYWEWPQDAKRTAIRNLMENEENRAMFSIHHVEANLINEAQRLSELDVVSHQESHDYWDMPTNAVDIDDRRIVQIQDEYWEWPAPQNQSMEKEILMARILHEERIRQILSIEHIEANLRKQAAELGWKDSNHEWSIVDKPRCKLSDTYWLDNNHSDGLTA